MEKVVGETKINRTHQSFTYFYYVATEFTNAFMARVFTTEFEFLENKYRAIIAIKNEESRMVVHIRVFDDTLVGILGHNSMEFAGLTGFKQMDGLTHPLALPLLEVISKAVLQHLLQ